MATSSPASAAAGVFFRMRVLATLLVCVIVLPGFLAHGAPYATPTLESPTLPHGSITLSGWDGVTEISFVVKDSNGATLESGVMTSDYYESDLLVGTEGAMLTLFANLVFAEVVVPGVPNQDGGLEFHATLVPAASPDESSGTMNRAGMPSAEAVNQNLEPAATGDEILFTVVLPKHSGSSRWPAGNLITFTDSFGYESSVRSDGNGMATLSLIPGTYDVRIDPYGSYAGTQLSVNVSAETSTVTVALKMLDSGSLRVVPDRVRSDMPVARVFNNSGVMIGEARITDPNGHWFYGMAFGPGYTVQIEGNKDFLHVTSRPFDFYSSTTVVVPMKDRVREIVYFSITTSDHSALPAKVNIDVSNLDWNGTVVAQKHVSGPWVGEMGIPIGDVAFSVRVAGYEPVSGVTVVTTNISVVNIVLKPDVTEPNPTPTAEPSPSPTVVPTPTATVAPTPVPTEVPAPTVAPSPTTEPTVVPSPSPTPEPTKTPSPVPTEVPSPTVEPSPSPTVVPTPTATVAPTPMPTEMPSPAAEPTVVPSPSPEPTMIPSPVPTEVPAPTVAPSPTAEPTVIPGPSPTDVPSPLPTEVLPPTSEPTVVPSPSPSPEPTNIPSPVPTEMPSPTVVPSPTPAEVSSPTAEPTVVPSPSPSPEPTVIPSPVPTEVPSPTAEPTLTATAEPSPTPASIETPSPSPTVIPSPLPTKVPAPIPTAIPDPVPTMAPSPTPVPSPTASSSPAATQTATEAPVNESGLTTSVVLEAPNGQSLDGAPYDLYAPVASQTVMAPYRSGFVGTGNRIDLADVPEGDYRLVVRPTDGTPIEFLVEVDEWEIGLVARAKPAEGKPRVTVPLGAGKDGSATANEPAETSGAIEVQVAQKVTGLPSTGVSPEQSSPNWLMPLASLLPITLLSGSLVIRRTIRREFRGRV